MFRLLCVTAHPDDEAGGFGGTLLTYADRGVETFVVCLTAGTAATHRGNTNSQEELAAVRRCEFAASCAHLKVTRGEVLDYPDGALDRADFHEIVGVLVRRVREIRPHVVITFGGEGAITAHLDHGMASVFTTMAFHWAARTNRYPEQLKNGLAPWKAQKLYYGTNSFILPERQPVALAPTTACIELPEELLRRKIEAFRKNTSQAPLFHLLESNTRRRGRDEMFHLVACDGLGWIERESDLFAGVKDED